VAGPNGVLIDQTGTFPEQTTPVSREGARVLMANAAKNTWNHRRPVPSGKMAAGMKAAIKGQPCHKILDPFRADRHL